MAQRTIFLSHSTKTPEAAGLLNAVADALKAEGYDLRYDQESLEPGVHWYDEISQWMMEADSAVLLWNIDALKSDYVRHEASVLSHRWRTEQDNFKLFIALIDDNAVLDPKFAKGGVSGDFLTATRIGEVNAWPMPAAIRHDPAAAAQAIVAKVVEQVGAGAYTKTRRDLLIDEIGFDLEPINSDAIKNAIDTPALDTLKLLYKKLPAAHRARALAAWVADEAPRDLPLVRKLLQALWPRIDTRPRENLRRCIAIAQAEWLSEARATCPIAAAVAQPATGEAAAINGKLAEYTLKGLWRRALNPSDTCILINCGDKSLDEMAIAEAIYAECETIIEMQPEDDAEVTAGFATERVICLMPKGHPLGTADRRLLDDLRARFANIIFVAWPGIGEDDLARADGYKPIAPAVDPNREFQHYLAWKQFSNALKAQSESNP